MYLHSGLCTSTGRNPSEWTSTFSISGWNIPWHPFSSRASPRSRRAPGPCRKCASCSRWRGNCLGAPRGWHRHRVRGGKRLHLNTPPVFHSKPSEPNPPQVRNEQFPNSTVRPAILVAAWTQNGKGLVYAMLYLISRGFIPLRAAFFFWLRWAAPFRSKNVFI